MQKSGPDYASVASILAKFISTNRSFIVVWLTLFISIVGIGMVSPLLPVFAEDKGASGIWLGLAFSGFALSQVPLMPIVGKFSDRFGKKFFICFGLLVYAIAAVGYIWSPSYRELVFFRVFSGIGAATVIPTAFAYIGELAPRGYEGRYMGLFNIAMISGYGIGPLIGGVIHDSINTNATFSSMAILSIMGFVIVLLFLPKRTDSLRGNPSMGMASREPSASWMFILGDSSIKGIVTFQLVYGLLFGTVLTFLGIWMTKIIHTSVAQVGIVLSARVILNGALSYPFGWLADRTNRIVLPCIGMAIVAIGTFSIPWFGSFVLLMYLFIAIGIFESMAVPSISAITVEKGRRMGMGSVMAISNVSQSLGLVIGAIGGGFIESSIGLVNVFYSVAVLGFIGVIIFGVFMLRSSVTSK